MLHTYIGTYLFETSLDSDCNKNRHALYPIHYRIFCFSDDDDDDLFVDDMLDDYHNGLYGIGWGPGGEDILLL